MGGSGDGGAPASARDDLCILKPYSACRRPVSLWRLLRRPPSGFLSLDCAVNPPFFTSRASRGWKSVSMVCYFLSRRMKSRGVLCRTKSSLTDDRVTQRRRAAVSQDVVASRLASRVCHQGTCSWRSARPAVQHRPCDGLQPLLSILSRTLGCAQLQLRLVHGQRLQLRKVAKHGSLHGK